jgi:aldehyde dehydrogenase (NAD+)/phenylacetaldehyde dehydrogenase
METIDRAAAEFLHGGPLKMFLGGEWRASSDGAITNVSYPATGEVVGSVAEATPADVEIAVKSAKEAFVDERWSGLRPDERAAGLLALASLVDRDREIMAVLETLHTGKPIRESRGDIARGLDGIRFYAASARNMRGETIPVSNDFHSYTVREPVGIVACIVPWNVPFVLMVSKAAPALAGGNSVVVKPATATPFTALYLAKLWEEARLPAGVFNVLTGAGSRVGEALCLHPDVAGITLTGSTEVGLHLGSQAALANKRTMLELGGKSPDIVFNDADLERAIAGAGAAIFYGQGEICSAGSRLIVQSDVHDVVVDGVRAYAEALKIGDPLDPETQMGSLISEAHLQRILKTVRDAVADGARIVTGGDRAVVPAMPRGAFMAPTVLDGVSPSALIAQEEVFGPVLVVHSFTDTDEAVALANGTRYGLSAGIWSRNAALAKRVARRLHSGVVWINDYNQFNPAMPFGGVGVSGTSHREWSHLAVDAFMEYKSIWERI